MMLSPRVKSTKSGLRLLVPNSGDPPRLRFADERVALKLHRGESRPVLESSLAYRRVPCGRVRGLETAGAC